MRTALSFGALAVVTAGAVSVMLPADPGPRVPVRSIDLGVPGTATPAASAVTGPTALPPAAVPVDPAVVPQAPVPAPVRAPVPADVADDRDDRDGPDDEDPDDPEESDDD